MVQEVKTVSWGSRIVGALWGVIIGIALILGGIYVVFWNEGHGLHVSQSLQEAGKIVVSVKDAPVDPQNDLKVVYFTGLATTEDVLHDDVFGVSEKAIQLNRHVEMYQWSEEKETETENNTGGSQTEKTTYHYEKTWSSELIDSSQFKEAEEHKNPHSMSVDSKMKYASHVTVGDYVLPHALVKEISGDTVIDLSKVNTAALKERFHKQVTVEGDTLYIGESSDSPQIGDMRVTITGVFPQDVSVIAQQTGKTLQPYMATAGQAIALLEMGKMSPQQVIQEALSENQLMTWIFRVLSLLMLIVGFALIMRPAVVLADVVPFFGSIVGFGTGAIAFILGLLLWAGVITVAWITVRPLWSVTFIVVALAISFFVYKRKKTEKKSSA